MAESIITSVTNQAAFARPHGDSASDYLPSQTVLNVRGRRFVLDRETLNHLPDSLLNTMFPNGLMHIGRSYGTYGYGSGDYPYYRSHGDEPSEPTWVDFDPDMLEYMLRAYSETLEFDLLSLSRPPQPATADVPSQQPAQGNAGDKQGSAEDQEGDDQETPAWLNYTNDGKANISGSRATAEPGKPAGSSPAATNARAGDSKNDSISTFTDTGSHVNNSSSGATHSTSSSALLSYMRFVSDGASRANNHGQAVAEVPEMPAETTVAYYDRNPLVVLREELDYFVVPCSGRTKGNISEVPGFTMEMAKTRCGELLVEDDSVFEPLERTMQRNLEKWRSKMSTEGSSDEAQALQSASVIEQQLIDMLCLAGFPRDARWGCRRVEPSKTSVTSLLTVPLDESSDQSRMIAAQKLLLFYKKPARKCWWEGEDVNAGDNEHKIDLKLWCRRTWTLELVLV
ncbi:hypothetical protein LPJ56_003265 [Coemansia sp. RSA 2599]|nr:hypothetical protein LPJ75_001099 [Coemansia sp. RSA 2598]KAJ1821322.1 hypothetical protein LPJ56_003265 [Coemansia sp. RSA 2599]